MQHELLVPDRIPFASGSIINKFGSGVGGDGAKGGDDILVADVLLSKIIIARQVRCMGCETVRGAGVGGPVVRFVIVMGSAKFKAYIIEAYRFNTR